MNEKNLKPIQSESEAREKGRLGGIKSGEKRREKAILKNQLLMLLKTKDIFDGSLIREEVCMGLIKAAINGNVKAFEIIRDTIGEKPKENIEQVVPLEIIVNGVNI